VIVDLWPVTVEDAIWGETGKPSKNHKKGTHEEYQNAISGQFLHRAKLLPD